MTPCSVAVVYQVSEDVAVSIFRVKRMALGKRKVTQEVRWGKSCFRLGITGIELAVGSPTLADREQAWLAVSEAARWFTGRSTTGRHLHDV
jgi:hypothetical protein